MRRQETELMALLGLMQRSEAMGEDVIFDEVSFAGMLACTRKSDGSQQLYFPHDLVGANDQLNATRLTPVAVEAPVGRK